VRARARVCVRACVRACVRVCVCVLLIIQCCLIWPQTGVKCISNWLVLREIQAAINFLPNLPSSLRGLTMVHKKTVFVFITRFTPCQPVSRLAERWTGTLGHIDLSVSVSVLRLCLEIQSSKQERQTLQLAPTSKCVLGGNHLRLFCVGKMGKRMVTGKATRYVFCAI